MPMSPSLPDGRERVLAGGQLSATTIVRGVLEAIEHSLERDGIGVCISPRR